MSKSFLLAWLFILYSIMGLLLVGAKRGSSKWPHERKNKPDQGAMEDLVTNMPGQPSVTFRHYAGHVIVNEKNGRALFYWFFEAMTSPDQKPLLLWLNGGPGCSSVGYGASEEIGPFLVDSDNGPLKFNPYAWNKEANVIFLESPVGVGFSYSNVTDDYKILGDSFTANDTYTFLHNWFNKFPYYRNRTFYLAGESYAGKYVPELAELIYDKNKEDPSRQINLKGFMLGNPETSNAEDWQGLVDYAWSHAVVSDQTYKTIKEFCNFTREDTWDNDNCSKSVDEIFTQYNYIDIYSLYTPKCNKVSPGAGTYMKPVMSKSSSLKRMPRMRAAGCDPCLDNYAHVYYNRADVQKALHVSDGRQVKNWSICNDQIFHEWKDSPLSVLPIYNKLISAGIRVWVYSGDADGRVPVLGTRYCLESLGLPTVGPWRPWYHEKQVSGWVQEYEGLTFATLRGAGHDVPTFKPSDSLALFTAFLVGLPPPSKP